MAYGSSLRSHTGCDLPFEGINNIHSSDCLPLGVLGVGDGVPDDILKEYLQDSPSLLVDKTRNPLHSTPPSQSPNSRLGDPLDVISQHFTVPLGSSLAQSLTSLATTSHSVD